MANMGPYRSVQSSQERIPASFGYQGPGMASTSAAEEAFYRSWDAAKVRRWCEEHAWGHFADRFIDNNVLGRDFLEVQYGKLHEIIPRPATYGDRKSLLQDIRSIPIPNFAAASGQPSPTTHPPPTASHSLPSLTDARYTDGLPQSGHAQRNYTSGGLVSSAYPPGPSGLRVNTNLTFNSPKPAPVNNGMYALNFDPTAHISRDGYDKSRTSSQLNRNRSLKSSENTLNEVRAKAIFKTAPRLTKRPSGRRNAPNFYGNLTGLANAQLGGYATVGGNTRVRAPTDIKVKEYAPPASSLSAPEFVPTPVPPVSPVSRSFTAAPSNNQTSKIIQVTLDGDALYNLNVAGCYTADSIWQCILSRLLIKANDISQERHLWRCFYYNEDGIADTALSDEELLQACQRSDRNHTVQLLVRPCSVQQPPKGPEAPVADDDIYGGAEISPVSEYSRSSTPSKSAQSVVSPTLYIGPDGAKAYRNRTPVDGEPTSPLRIVEYGRDVSSSASLDGARVRRSSYGPGNSPRSPVGKGTDKVASGYSRKGETMAGSPAASSPLKLDFTHDLRKSPTTPVSPGSSSQLSTIAQSGKPSSREFFNLKSVSTSHLPQSAYEEEESTSDHSSWKSTSTRPQSIPGAFLMKGQKRQSISSRPSQTGLSEINSVSETDIVESPHEVLSSQDNGMDALWAVQPSNTDSTPEASSGDGLWAVAPSATTSSHSSVRKMTSKSSFERNLPTDSPRTPPHEEWPPRLSTQSTQFSQEDQGLWAVAPSSAATTNSGENRRATASTISNLNSSQDSLFDLKTPTSKSSGLHTPATDVANSDLSSAMADMHITDPHRNLNRTANNRSPSPAQQSPVTPRDMVFDRKFLGEGVRDTEKLKSAANPAVFWGERPPAEVILEHPEKFFQEHDLDKALLESAPISDNQRRPLGHTTSIRHVTREASQKLKTAANAVRAGHMLRRKTTKLWGRRIEQLEPGKASRATKLTSPGSPQNTKIQWVKGDLIGKGSFGRVYHALNVADGEAIAVKQVEIPTTKSDLINKRQQEMVQALYHEISLLKDLDHPNIVQYLGFDITDEYANIFLEYVSGGSIASILHKVGALDEAITRNFTRQILLGLDYLHERNILHRDIKGANILVDQDGVCKISDFGLSKKNHDAYDPESKMSFQGSIFWMAPEVVKNQPYSAKIDIWSLGCLVVEMITGQRPWLSLDNIGALYQLGQCQSPDIPSNLSEAGKDFLRRCFAIDPVLRPTAADLLVHPFCRPDNSFKFKDYIQKGKMI
ncbi:hypothetical protein BZG36_01730 [Bifiguratus adelaidae]|uniref:Protein kinase domain-containing protein n=1 Tax=Bifiguratus adelaidae TaxID=1938954 RepID=A0A261Y2Y2_9FUNG|nr:hypothetical protein BZG36_01730 [Bifiguratus adelaidae]